MIRALSTAASGMQAQQLRLDVTANNIANSSTPGFKKARAEFQDLMYQNLRGPNEKLPTGLQVGLGTRIAGTVQMQGEGDIKQTNNPLDIAIEGSGLFPIELPTGETAYTRDGSFKVNAEGRLVNNEGYPLITDISIPPDTQTLNISPDGKVTATVAGETSSVELGEIQVATFANPAGLVQLGRNLLKETSASGTAVLGSPGEGGAGTLAQGSLELSNVNVVEEMIDLISGQRAYEVAGRVVKAADEMLQQTANLR
jgi:flagellar basal-body rod protein FlgG